MIHGNMPLPEMINDQIREQVKWFGHYFGQIVSTEIRQRGATKVCLAKITVPELGLVSNETAIWAFPRMGMGQTIPKIKDYAEIYFYGGRPEKAYYLYPAPDIENNGFKSLSNLEHLLYEPREDSKKNIKYRKSDGCLIIYEGNEPFVLGNKLKTELKKAVDALQQLQTDFTNWVVVPNDGGQALKTQVTTGFLTKALPVLTDILSILIKGK